MKVKELIPFLEKNKNEFKVHFAIGTPKVAPLIAFLDGKFEQYQREQTKKNFERKYILSLAYYDKDKWLFLGIFESFGSKPSDDKSYAYIYNTKLSDIGAEYIGKLVIYFKKTSRQSYPYLENIIENLEISDENAKININNKEIELYEKERNIQKAIIELSNNESQKLEYTKKILNFLKEQGTTQDISLIGAFGAEYRVIKSIVDEITASGLIKRKDRKYQITKKGEKALDNQEKLKESIKEKFFRPADNEELKNYIKSGKSLEHVLLDGLDDLSEIFKDFHGDLSAVEQWNTEKVINMTGIFENCDLKGLNLSNWDVSSVENMSRAFKGAKNIAGIENWNTKSLENIDEIFAGCESFNLDIRSWRTEHINSLKSAFNGAKAFDGARLNEWHLRDLDNCQNIFKDTKSIAEWACDNVDMEFYIYNFNKEIPNDFNLITNSDELKQYLNTGISWLRDEIKDDIKFYFKNNEKGKWEEMIICLFDLKFLVSKIKKDGYKEHFCVYLKKLTLDIDEKDEEIIAEEVEVNPLIHIIKSGENYDIKQNNDDIYFGYKGIFVDSNRYSIATRTIILYILARAYKEKMEGFIVAAASANELSKINEKACRFSLEKYFTMPVIARDGALQAGIWAKIYNLYELNETQAQITAKISTMASILEAQSRAELERLEKERQDTEKARAEKFTKYALYATLFVTIFAGILPMIVTWLSGK